MVGTAIAQRLSRLARRRPAIPTQPRTRGDLTRDNRTQWFGIIAGMACIATMAATATAQQRSAKEVGEVTALIVMTPNGPATCATWVQWRLPTANPIDKAAVEYWAEGYLSGLAAGSRHDVIGAFRRDALATWLTRYCTDNPQTPLPEAIAALGLAMLAHPGGQL
jgi:hypothetical protein